MYDGQIYFSVTMGSKEQIWFGKLNVIEKDGKLYIREVTDSAEEQQPTDLSAYEDLADFTLLCDSVRTKQDGSVVCATYVKRDDKGIYFYGETDGELTSNKLFFMLDTQGTATKLGATASPENLMFRFYNDTIQVKAVDADNSRAYKDLTTFGGVECFKIQQEDGTKVGIYLPYAALKQIAPNATFTDTAADLYIAVYGAEGSAEYVPTLCGQNVDWEKPSTYVILTADGTLKAR